MAKKDATSEKDSGSKNMAESKQVTDKSRSFWFPDGTNVKAKTAMEAAKKKSNKKK